MTLLPSYKTIAETILKEGTHFARLARRKIKPEEFLSLWNPPLRALAKCGVSYKTKMFFHWGEQAIQEMGGRKFLLTHKGKKEKILSLLRHYKLPEKRNASGELCALTLCHEIPGESGTIPPNGMFLNGAVFNNPNITDESPATWGPNGQTHIRPLGKNGVVCLHSFHQTCLGREVTGEVFQRFLIGPSPQETVNRAALTLRALAGADPKTIEAGKAQLINIFGKGLRELAQESQASLEGVRNAKTTEDLKETCKFLGNYLPEIKLDGVCVEIVPEKAFGPDPRSWAISIRTTTKTSSPEENQAVFSQAWSNLLKA